jgi:hypothetical protein
MPTPARLPVNLQKRLNAELSAGERILYAAQPDWRAQWGLHAIVAFFGVGWMAICGPMAVFVWAEALGVKLPNVEGGMGRGMALFFSLFMIPFIVIGLACLLEPLIAARRSKRAAHAVTDQRLLSIVDTPRAEVESIKLDRINFIRRREGKPGFGSLSIGYGVELDSDGSPQPLKTDWPGIPDAKHAETLIREHAKWVR